MLRFLRSPRLRLQLAGMIAVTAALTQAVMTSRNPPDRSAQDVPPLERPATPSVVRTNHTTSRMPTISRHDPAAAAPEPAPQAPPQLIGRAPCVRAASLSGTRSAEGGRAVPRAAQSLPVQPVAPGSVTQLADKPQELAWIAIHPAAPGQLLTYQGLQARIVAYQPVPASHGVAFSVMIDGTPPAANDLPSTNLTAAPEQAENTTPPHAAAAVIGFTYEQQLFRTKWGWQAFDQMQLALAIAATEAP